MLQRQGFDVTIFEKGPKPGFAAHSCDVADLLPDVNVPLVGDIPSRMFNDALWPSVTQLYRDAGIEFEAVDQQQTFHQSSEVLLKVALPYRFSNLLRQGMNSTFRKLAGSITTFRELGNAALDSGKFTDATFGEFVQSISDSFPEPFIGGFLYPSLTSTVFTCPREELDRFPADVVLDALRKITSDQAALMRTVSGSLAASQKLLASVDAMCFNTSVESVCVENDQAIAIVGGQAQAFDHLIVATQANHAIRLIADAMPTESRILKQFKYVDVPVVLHTDSSVLPVRRDDWGTFNFESHVAESNCVEATCTVWMNRFHKQWPDATDVFHSIFPTRTIDPSKVLASVTMQRPVVDSETMSLHRDLERSRSEDGRIWFCGSYAAPGVPLLESAVVSSKNVVAQICEATSKLIG